MYFGHRTTNTVTNRIQIDYLKHVLIKGFYADCVLNTLK